LLALYAL